jgi:hypothetical protein
LFHALLFQREGLFRLIWPLSEAPEAEENQDGDKAEELEEDTNSMTSPPPALSEDTGVDKKRKRVDEFTSSEYFSAENSG